ncbi:unnamed protein product [Amoebophrya sp. A120]|nr:unnamed protein product [Amoebophrya sp. A120]|eukprot:GSA120T00024765001.1
MKTKIESGWNHDGKTMTGNWNDWNLDREWNGDALRRTTNTMRNR